MFICEHTGEVVAQGIKQSKVVLERREKTYQKPIKKYGKVVDWEEVRGWEIVKEISVGPDGYRALTGKEPVNIGSASTSLNAAMRPEKNSRPVEPWRYNRQRRFNNDRGGQQRDNRPQGNNRRGPVVEVINRPAR